MTELIEFKNKNGELLRGLFDEADSELGIVFVHGFERTTVERKFKNLVDYFLGKANMMRFDFSGCGLSDGNFTNMTVQKLSSELMRAIIFFQKSCPQIKSIVLVAHSLASCVVLDYLSKNKAKKLVMLGPALNQKALLRYYFVVGQNKDKKVNWLNYNNYLKEQDFQNDLNRENRYTKEHILGPDYFNECQDKDYQDLLNNIDLPLNQILVVHGDMDEKVPLESNDKLSKDINMIKVSEGDHDLQKIKMSEQYLKRVIEFIIG